MKRRNFIRLFDRRKSQIDARVRRDYVKNGIGTIFCRISGYHDVITAYSVKDHETMNLEFVDYLRGAAKVIPAECPLVLNIIGGNLSEAEKETIETVIRDDFAYDFGMVEQEEKRERNIFLCMFVGLIVAGLLLCLTEVLDEVPRDPFDSTRPIGYNAGQGTIHTVGAKGDFSGRIPKPTARYGGLKGDYYRYIYRIDGSLL